jgi:integrase
MMARQFSPRPCPHGGDGRVRNEAATGVRAGEFHGLCWHHVSLESGEVKIEARVDAYGDEDVTKTAAGMRTVPLGAQVITALKEWKLRSKNKKPASLIFPSKRGGYTGHDNWLSGNSCRSSAS